MSQEVLVMSSSNKAAIGDQKKGNIRFRIIDKSGVNYEALKLERICLAPTDEILNSLDCTISNFQSYSLAVSDTSSQEILVLEGDYVGFIQIRGAEDFENIYSRIIFDANVSENAKCSHLEKAEGFNFLDIEKCSKLKIRNGKIVEVQIEITNKFESFFGEALFIGIISFGLASPQMNIRHTRVNLKNPIN
ncbi:hypothetical protein [Leptospira wolffii]|uniref:hypothetical protein n=1 Tax=Leptospira wolffii TaxID=409998 RepID=UPI00058F8040|nr:hypothetical protein [Leptospira wolffii]